jgi:alpha-beta hydrolase superfamily lysophospholipase
MIGRAAMAPVHQPSVAPHCLPGTPRITLILIVICAVLLGPGTSASSRVVNFRAADGTSLVADLYEPQVQPAPAIVLVHMLTRSRLDWAATAERIEEAGFVALAVDLRGHGQSGGALDPGGDLAPMQRDVQAAVAFLKSRSNVTAGRIGIAGASLGANLAVLVAAADPSIRSLALLSASSDYKGLRIEAALRKVDRPVLLVAGSDDPYALRSAASLAATGARRETATLSDAGHGTTMLTRHHDLTNRLVDWFRRTLL